MRNTAIISPPSGGLEKCSFSEKIQFCAHLLLHVGKPMDTWFAFPTWRNTFDFSPLSIQFSVYLMESKNAIGFPMAFGTGKGCWYFTSAPFILPVFDFLTSHRVPCLWKHWFYWTISCFLIRRRGRKLPSWELPLLFTLPMFELTQHLLVIASRLFFRKLRAGKMLHQIVD